MDDAVSKAARPLNVLTAYDHLRRIAMLGVNAAGLGLMAAVIAPHAIMSSPLFLGAVLGYCVFRGSLILSMRFNEPSSKGPRKDDVPAFIPRAIAHFADLAKTPVPSVIRMDAPDTCAQASVNVGYVTPRIGFTTGLEREYDRMALAAFLAHEIGHITHDNQFVNSANTGLLMTGRAARWGMVACAALGALPLTPAIAATAILAPVLMHIAQKSNMRHSELINDRFAAAAMGSPVPLARAFALNKRAVKEFRLVGKFAPPIPSADEPAETRMGRALRFIDAFENSGLFATHPTHEFRRKALASMRHTGRLNPQDSKVKALRAILE